MEILFEVLGALVLQVVVEALLLDGMHAVATPFRKASRAWRQGLIPPGHLAAQLFDVAPGGFGVQPLAL